MQKVRLTQIDGRLPNLALMKLSHWHKANGDAVYFERGVTKGIFEPEYDVVYGSAIFSTSEKKIEQFKKNFPNAIVGGTGSTDNTTTVEIIINLSEYEYYDYDIYPDFDASIGFSQRGCRLRCKFCVVPTKEGKNTSNNTIFNIWKQNPRNKGKKIHLLDNDFFGQPNWKEKANEIIDGGYRICFNQGINIRLIDDEGADEFFVKLELYRLGKFEFHNPVERYLTNNPPGLILCTPVIEGYIVHKIPKYRLGREALLWLYLFYDRNSFWREFGHVGSQNTKITPLLLIENFIFNIKRFRLKKFLLSKLKAKQRQQVTHKPYAYQDDELPF